MRNSDFLGYLAQVRIAHVQSSADAIRDLRQSRLQAVGHLIRILRDRAIMAALVLTAVAIYTAVVVLSDPVLTETITAGARMIVA